MQYARLSVWHGMSAGDGQVIRIGLTKAQTLAIVERWRDYYWAQAQSHPNGSQDRSLYLSNLQRVQEDLAYLKRGKNWREYQDGVSSIYGAYHPWYRMYPQTVSSSRY